MENKTEVIIKQSKPITHHRIAQAYDIRQGYANVTVEQIISQISKQYKLSEKELLLTADVMEQINSGRINDEVFKEYVLV